MLRVASFGARLRLKLYEAGQIYRKYHGTAIAEAETEGETSKLTVEESNNAA